MKSWIEVWQLEPMEWDKNITDKLTGRWKIHTNNSFPEFFLEVKRFWFKEWVSEYYLTIENHSEQIFDCHRK